MLASSADGMQNMLHPFDTFSSLPTEAASYVSNNTNGTEQRLSTLLENAKFAAVQTDVTTEFEIADGLTNYATVNTSEPIPTQLSYNIGTENIENGKDGETLNNTEMQLEESSLITEFENQGVDLYDLSQSNVTSFDIAMLDPEYNAKISENSNIKVVNLEEKSTEQEKSNGIDKSLDSNDLFGAFGLSSQWDNLINSFNTNLEPDPSLTLQQPYPYFNSNIIDSTINQNTFAESVPFEQEQIKTQKSDTNVLKTLTAEADICKCIDCKCTPNNNCHGCTQGTAPAIEIVNPKTSSIETKSGCCTGQCGESKTKLSRCQSSIVEQLQKCCGDEENNNKSGDPCCVVVCLKTINQLKEMLEMATHFAEKNNAVGEFRGAKEATITSTP